MIPRSTEGYEEQKTIAFAFDGVVHSAVSGWEGFDVIPDEPVEGVKEAFESYRKKGYRIVIYSTRAITVEGWRAILSWLAKWNMYELVDQVSKFKPVADVYVDSKAVHFTGFDGLLEEIEDVIRKGA